MDLQEFAEKFRALASKEKCQFLKENIHHLREEEKIFFLLSIIKNRKYSSFVRSSALQALSQTSFQDSHTLQRLSKDRSKAVVTAAKKALKELKSREGRDHQLSQLVLRKIRACAEKEKKLKIIKSITHLRGSWINKVLLEALEDHSEEVRDFIIRELGERQDLSLNSIHPKLLRPPWYVKSSVLRILAIQKNPVSISLIAGIIGDANAEVRRSAAVALGEIGGEEALILLNKLAKDNNRFVRKSAEEALSKASQLKFS